MQLCIITLIIIYGWSYAHHCIVLRHLCKPRRTFFYVSLSRARKVKCVMASLDSDTPEDHCVIVDTDIVVESNWLVFLD